VARLLRVAFVVTCWLVLVAPQLHVEPVPPVLGEPVAVTLRRDGTNDGIPGIPITVELPDGSSRSIGTTGNDGRVEFVPAVVGDHVFVVVPGGVRHVAPVTVVAPRSRWPFALGAVPLGLALLWWNWRAAFRPARDRRGP
jgi:hypothetical protein